MMLHSITMRDGVARPYLEKFDGGLMVSSLAGLSEFPIDLLVLKDGEEFQKPHDFPVRYWENLKKRGIKEHYPLQEQAFGRYHLLEGSSAVIHAPTTSGKTLVAEWCAMKRILAGKQAWYMAPTRALATEKYREWKKAFRDTGVEVGISTGDWRKDDDRIRDGQFDIVITVLEKATRLIFHSGMSPSLIGLIIIDEAHMIGDPVRGGELDFLLTWWKRQPCGRPQLLLLSAILTNSDEIARWLGIDRIHFPHRSSCLREGTLNLETGDFKWRNQNSGKKGTETLLDSEDIDRDSNISENVQAIVRLAKRYGPLLCFVPTRKAAGYLAQACQEFLSELHSDEDLSIAVHTADLTSGQRTEIEQDFRAGKIRLLISTSTLEQGVNLSPAIVVHHPKMIALDRVTDRHQFSSLSPGRFQNQGGRAGRKQGSVGRSILVANNALEEHQYWQSIINPEAEPARSPLLTEVLSCRICQMIQDWSCRTVDDLEDALASTLAAEQLKWQSIGQEWKSCLTDALEELLNTKVIDFKNPLENLHDKRHGQIILSGKGEFIASWKVNPSTLNAWSEFLNFHPVPSSLELLFLVQLADEWNDVSLPLSCGRNSFYPEFLGRLDEQSQNDQFRTWVESSGGPERKHLLRMAQALYLDRVISNCEEGPVYSQGSTDRLIRQAL